jgi:cellulose synthase (UDP-forming)
VIAGDDEQQLLTAARTLALTRRESPGIAAQGARLSGDTMSLPDLILPPVRRTGDAPRWMPTDRTAPLTGSQAQPSMQSDGSTPIPIYFHLPPDLFYGERENLKLHVFYRYNAFQAGLGSALRVVVNGALVNEIPLAPGADFTNGQRTILVPVADLRPFGNTILFSFDFVPANREQAQDSASANLFGEILNKSSLDIQGLASWTRMPNLELFADAGFPFTQLADLSTTTVVLPVAPNEEEVSLYLDLMGNFGAQTGYPAIRVKVDGPNAVISRDRNYLVLGTVAHQPAFHSLDRMLPVTLDPSGLRIKPVSQLLSPVSRIATIWSNWMSKLTNTPEKQVQRLSSGELPDALIEEVQSPVSSDFSIVVVALKDDTSADTFAGVLLDGPHSGDIAESVSVLRNSAFESYSMDTPSYHTGNISWYARMRIWLTQNFMLLLLSVSMLSFLVAVWIREWLSNHAKERLKLAEVPTAAS